MSDAPLEDGFSVVEGDPDAEAWVEEDDPRAQGPAPDEELENLREEFVAAFNARDLDAVLGLVSPDVECPDIPGDGAEALAEEIESIWARSPGGILTRAFLDGSPCAVGWLPDEDGLWSRAALVCFDTQDGQISVVAMPDDADTLDRAEAEEPTGEELDEWSDWSEWDRGEETIARRRDRDRP